MEQQVDYSKKWLVMAAVAMGVFLATIDGSIVNVALPTMRNDYQVDLAVIQWVVLGYLLTQSTLMLSVGRLGDMVGKKKIYLMGFVAFTIGSALCGLAPTVTWLIIFRVVQAVGAAMTAALGAAIVTEAFPQNERGKALGVIGTIVSIGVVAGPTIGGFMLGVVSWHWIFYVNIPIGVLGILMVWRFVPNLVPQGKQQFDFGGAAILLVGLLSLLLSLTFVQSLGVGNLLVVGLFVVFLLGIAFFIWQEKRVAQPMIQLSMFKNRLFSINLITGFLNFLSMAGFSFLATFYLSSVLNLDSRSMGMLLSVVPIFMGVLAPISGSLSDRYGTRPITVVGLSLMLIGYLVLRGLGADTTPFQYILHAFPLGMGMGMFNSPNNSAIMGSVKRENLGVASGMTSITRVVGQTAGISLLNAIWVSRVTKYAGGVLVGDVTQAPVNFQVAGLHDVLTVAAGLAVLSLLLAVWGLLQERKSRREV